MPQLAALHKLAYPLTGALLGYLYHRLVGCASGACPIVANPWTSSIYGLLIGLSLMGAR